MELITVPTTPTIQKSPGSFSSCSEISDSIDQTWGYSRPYAKSASEDLGSMDTWDHFRDKSKLLW